jgi:hypothetical protein
MIDAVLRSLAALPLDVKAAHLQRDFVEGLRRQQLLQVRALQQEELTRQQKFEATGLEGVPVGQMLSALPPGQVAEVFQTAQGTLGAQQPPHAVGQVVAAIKREGFRCGFEAYLHCCAEFARHRLEATSSTISDGAVAASSSSSLPPVAVVPSVVMQDSRMLRVRALLARTFVSLPTVAHDRCADAVLRRVGEEVTALLDTHTVPVAKMAPGATTPTITYELKPVSSISTPAYEAAMQILYALCAQRAPAPGLLLVGAGAHGGLEALMPAEDAAAPAASAALAPADGDDPVTALYGAVDAAATGAVFEAPLEWARNATGAVPAAANRRRPRRETPTALNGLTFAHRQLNPAAAASINAIESAGDFRGSLDGPTADGLEFEDETYQTAARTNYGSFFFRLLQTISSAISSGKRATCIEPSPLLCLLRDAPGIPLSGWLYLHVHMCTCRVADAAAADVDLARVVIGLRTLSGLMRIRSDASLVGGGGGASGAGLRATALRAFTILIAHAKEAGRMAEFARTELAEVYRDGITLLESGDTSTTTESEDARAWDLLTGTTTATGWSHEAMLPPAARAVLRFACHLVRCLPAECRAAEATNAAAAEKVVTALISSRVALLATLSTVEPACEAENLLIRELVAVYPDLPAVAQRVFIQRGVPEVTNAIRSAFQASNITACTLALVDPSVRTAALPLATTLLNVTAQQLQSQMKMIKQMLTSAAGDRMTISEREAAEDRFASYDAQLRVLVGHCRSAFDRTGDARYIAPVSNYFTKSELRDLYLPSLVLCFGSPAMALDAERGLQNAMLRPVGSTAEHATSADAALGITPIDLLDILLRLPHHKQPAGQSQAQQQMALDAMIRCASAAINMLLSAVVGGAAAAAAAPAPAPQQPGGAAAPGAGAAAAVQYLVPTESVMIVLRPLLRETPIPALLLPTALAAIRRDRNIRYRKAACALVTELVRVQAWKSVRDFWRAAMLLLSEELEMQHTGSMEAIAALGPAAGAASQQEAVVALHETLQAIPSGLLVPALRSDPAFAKLAQFARMQGIVREV